MVIFDQKRYFSAVFFSSIFVHQNLVSGSLENEMLDLDPYPQHCFQDSKNNDDIVLKYFPNVNI
jgi:hypothetical protein